MIHTLPKGLVTVIRKVFYLLPTRFRFLARRIYYFPIDLIDGVLGRRHKYQPRKGKIFIGSGDFIKLGKGHLSKLILLTGLKPNHNVLDIGSGIGRTALPLTEFLDKEAAYEGFDVTKEGIEWCNNKIHRDFPNFSFTYVNLGNDLYNNSMNTAANYKFPYTSNRFDVSFLFSVFTHMQPDEVFNYLKEIERTLVIGGRCLATFFTYDDQTEQKILNNELDLNFPFEMGNYRLMSKNVISANVAFKNEFLLRMIDESNLKVENVIDGFWKTISTDDNEYQDIYILRK
ncbi:class I SAM-dependent methyltransferase [uncultured Aquimarina sp.]|uniref:class I SAM-dependent methyltransferase n=1 Tax=uncultured Aquimarina sp. TaxID=575652 RepID=UPI00261AAEA8|nr:class I SAM-dependent methyltransferase [uncultured Aquimarina sp.]